MDMLLPYFVTDNAAWNKFYAILKSWEGTPYRHLTMAKGRGADCTLFIAACWKEVRPRIIKRVVYDYYPRDWHHNTEDEFVLNNLFYHFTHHACTWNGFTILRMAARTKIKRGDLITFTTTQKKEHKNVTNHAAVYLGNGHMIHATDSRGVVETVYGSVWRRRTTSVMRIMKGKPWLLEPSY